MFDFKNNSSNCARRPSLYCVWIRAHEGENAPLIQVWIDPTMSQFESQTGARAPDYANAEVEAQATISDREES